MGFKIDENVIDSLTFKALLISRGIKVSNKVYRKYTDSIQITGGSTFNVQAECDKIEEILSAIDKRVGRKNIKIDENTRD